MNLLPGLSIDKCLCHYFIARPFPPNQSTVSAPLMDCAREELKILLPIGRIGKFDRHLSGVKAVNAQLYSHRKVAT